MPTVRYTAKVFTATLQRTGDRLNWVVIRVPFDAAKFWGRRGQIKVKGEVRAAGPAQRAGFAFRTSLFPDGKGNHFMMVNKQMQKGGGVRPGVMASFRLEPDTEERAVTAPEESPAHAAGVEAAGQVLRIVQLLHAPRDRQMDCGGEAQGDARAPLGADGRAPDGDPGSRA
jgi:hypothetical protein